MKYWEVKAAANKTGELLLYGDISDSKMWGDEITPLQIDADLKALGEIDTLNVYCNSGGGSVFAGMAIHNIIKRNKAKVKNAYVDGLAASIASVIIMACDKVYMFANSLIMIHNPAAIAIGTADEFRKMADTLDKVRDTISAVYEEKTKQDTVTIRTLMDAETWLTADEAVKRGFADEIEAEKKLAASMNGGFFMLNGQKFDLARYQNGPAIEEYQPPEQPEQPPDDSGGVSRPAEQRKRFNALKVKLYGG